MTNEEKIGNYDTIIHICRVNQLLDKVAIELIKRGQKHDESKLHPPESNLFAEYTPILSSMTYGSDEFNKVKEKLKVALDHHYANNRHHPENHKNGINDMNLIDIIEMFCDWKASSERHNDGNLKKSIEINKLRFGMSDQLAKIFENTVSFIED